MSGIIRDWPAMLTITDAVAICYCWLLLDVEQPTYKQLL